MPALPTLRQLAYVVELWDLFRQIGIYSAVRRHSVGDHVFTLLGFLIMIVGVFVIGDKKVIPNLTASYRRGSTEATARPALSI